jgi:hypothetical protein
MKKLAIGLISLSLSGCTTFNTMLDAYLMKYDTNEYKLVNDVRTTAEVGKLKCEDTVEAKNYANQLAFNTLALKNFAEFQLHNKPAQSSTIELDKIAQGLANQYNSGTAVSPAFCKIKFQIVEDSAKTIQRSEGKKPR